jgi:hypothetical protein
MFQFVNIYNYHMFFKALYTVKGARGKVSFDSQNDKYA